MGREDIGRKREGRGEMAQVRGFFLYMYFNLVHSVVLNWFVASAMLHKVTLLFTSQPCMKHAASWS